MPSASIPDRDDVNRALAQAADGDLRVLPGCSSQANVHTSRTSSRASVTLPSARRLASAAAAGGSPSR